MPDASPPSTWDGMAQQRWEQGDQQGAIDRLLAAINANPEAVPKALGLQLVYYIFLLGDLSGAEGFLQRLLAIHPGDADILENLAVVISRQPRRAADAIPLFEQICALRPDSANGWDGLASALARTEQHQRAQQAGERSLALKTAAARALPDWAPPSGTPQRFLQCTAPMPRRDCISFSIWGANPRYLRGALRNALLIPELYPGWQGRFYLDDTVPEDFRALLTQLGAECRLMPAGQSLRQKLCWRFLVANDPRVGRFLVRDCDSVVNQREVAAVQQWLASERWFHVMRDWWSHTDPILAGLWGGIAGVLPDLQTLLAAYTPTARETANVDQWFLRDVLWGSIRRHALIHDRCYASEGSQPWPQPNPTDGRHVGQDEFSGHRASQAAWLAPWIRRHTCLQLPDDNLPPPAAAPSPEAVIQAWPGPMPAISPEMPADVSGRILNLDAATERWRAIATQIDSLGWSSSHRRHPAQSASTEEARALDLRNGGELGLWRTTTTVLEQWLAKEPAPDAVLHVLEDDAVLHPALPVLIPLLRRSPTPLDILFSEAFLTASLYRRFRHLEQQRQNDRQAVLLLNGGQYLACASSYLLSRRGAQRLLQAMRDREATGRLQPIDMLMRAAIRDGRLSAAISLPFFSTIAAAIPSSLQHDRPIAVQRRQNADLSLRRLLYRQSWEPSACVGVLDELVAAVRDGLTPDQIDTLVLETLATGAAEGWLGHY